MSLQQERRFKEVTPTETVYKIKEILKRINLEVEEEWLPKSSVDTYSLRINIRNSNIGTNGKGVTKDLARASAYAELLERYQNLWLPRNVIRWQSNFDFHYFVDEIEMSAERIVSDNNSFIKMYFDNRNMSDSSLQEKVEAFKKIQKMDYNLFSKKSTYTSIPFFDVKENKIEYVPYNTYSVFYGSNGMCAGNTAEEALVQGLSEILERYVQKKIFNEKPTLPDVPSEYLNKLSHIQSKLESLKKIDGYTFLLKDCSFGGKYPAVALVVIEKNTGRYGFKLGCHPDYSLAIERCFTEATQGGDITEYVNRSKLNFNNDRVNDPVNIFNCFKIGLAQYPFEILDAEPTFDFIPFEDVSNKSNEEILKSMIIRLIQDGYSILVRDVSYLGFPSFHVIIPGMSEIVNMTDDGFEAINSRLFVSELLNNPEKIKKDHCKEIIKIMDYYSTSLKDNKMSSHYGVLVNFKLPAEEIHLGWLYLSAMCNAMLEDYNEAARRMSHIVRIANDNNPNKNFYSAVYQYFSGMKIVKDHTRVVKYLYNFFDEKICTHIDRLFHNPLDIIKKQYITHDYSDRNKCRELKCCDYHVYADCVDGLKSVQLKNHIVQSNLIALFQYHKK